MAGRKQIRSLSTPWPRPIGGPWRLTLRFAQVDGRPTCVAVTIEPLKAPTQPLTTRVLRDIALGRVMDKMRWDAESMFSPRSRARKVVLRLTAASGKGRPRQYPDDHLVRVASIYRQAWEAHRPPTKAVAEN